jgi:hypothetical protein
MECSSKDKLHALTSDFRKERSEWRLFSHQPQFTDRVGTQRFRDYWHHVSVRTLPATVNLLKYHSALILHLSVFSRHFFSIDRYSFADVIYQLLKNYDPLLVCLQTHMF